MNTAFEITIEDIESLLHHEHYMDGFHLSAFHSLRGGEVFDEIFQELNKEDFDRIEKSALYGDDMDSQTDYAYQEIIEILAEKEILIRVLQET